MKIFLSIVLALLTISADAAQVVNDWLKVTGVTSGQNVSTPALFSSFTVGDGNITWANNTDTNCCFAITESKTWPRMFSIGGTIYQDSASYMAINIGLSNKLSSMIGNFTAQPTQVFCSMLIKFGSYNGGGNVYDIMGINFGNYALIPQYWESSSGHRVLFAHNANTPGLGHGIYDFALNTWFVLTMYLDAAHNLGTLTLYDATTGAFYASDSIFEPSGKQSAYVFIGPGSDHGTPVNPSSPIEIKDFTVSTGANADQRFSYFEPYTWNVTNVATVGTIQSP